MVAWAPLVLGAATIGSSIFGNKKAKKRSTMDKNQKKLWKDYNAGINGEGPLADLYKFDPQKATQNFQQNVARPAYENYQENVVPTITGAFRSKGLGNSSYAAQALERGGRMTQNDLNAKMTDYLFNQENSVNDRRANAVNNALGMTTFDYQKPNEDPFSGFLRGASGAAGKYTANQLFPGA